MHLFFYDTIIGRLGVRECDGKLTHLYFETDPIPEGLDILETPVIKETGRQLAAYFRGELKQFDLPLAPQGTPFMQKSWQELIRIPYGKVVTYRQVAQAIGNEKAVRAVGLANNRNPIPLMIPCHRVIGSDGKLVGYRGGLMIKKQLLELEARYADL